MYKFFYLLAFSVFLQDCYSLKGITVPVDAKTFTVTELDNNANQVVPGLAEDFAERLKNKIRNTTSLSFTNSETSKARLACCWTARR